MKVLNLIFSVFLSSGCTMLCYLSEQGVEQARIQWNGKANEKILKDSSVSPEIKRKIKLVEEYKSFFYRYFDQTPSAIYSKTTFLADEAVTYLVVASSHVKIEAREFEFPFMGSFPYIGFFKKSSAEKFAKDLERKERLVTYIRPVYAYSTLGYFEDRILSSFFQYDDVELAELVFHELFHTIFFVKNEVELNENLANLYGKEMLYEFFKGRGELEAYLINQQRKDLLMGRIVELIEILNQEFLKLGGFLTNEKADDITKRFVAEIFIPELNRYCEELKLEGSKCQLDEKWNQARFAAFLTYEKEQDFLKKLQLDKKFSLKDFLSWLKSEYNQFKKISNAANFTDHLKLHLRVTDAPVAVD
jgi:predicted aminopeptidase